MHLLLRMGLLLLLLVGAGASVAQQPLLSQLKPDLRVYPQFFSLAQGAHGDLYVGGTDGLLRFDGGRWRWYSLPKPGAVRVLHVDGGGRLWVGANNCFGYMQRDPNGDDHFVDLSSRFAAQLGGRDFADIWRLTELDGVLYFAGLHDLFAVSTNGAAAGYWHHEGRFGVTAVVAGELWVQWRGEGLKKKSGNDFVPVAGGEQFAKHLVYNLFELEDGRVLLHDVAPSLWLRDGTTFSSVAPVAGLAELQTLGRGIRLRDGNLAFAGSGGVVAVLDVAAWRFESVAFGKGYLSNLIEADDGGLFAVDPSGIARVDWPQRWRMFGADQGVETGIHRMTVVGDALYLASWNGASRIAVNAQRELGPMQALPWTNSEGWGYHSHHDRFLFADSRRLLQIESDQARVVSDDDLYPRTFLDDPVDPRLLWIGSEHGPALFEQTDSGYRQLHRDFKLGWSISGMVAFDGAIWAGSTRSGLARVTRDRLDVASFKFVPVGTDAGLAVAADNSVEVGLIDGALIASTGAGLFRYRDGRFEPDRLDGLAELMGDGEVVSFRQSGDGTRWAWSFHSVYQRRGSGPWQLSLLGGLNTGAISDLLPLQGDEAFVASESGVLQHRDVADRTTVASVVAPRVTSARIIRGPGRIESLALSAKPQFRLNGSSLEFDFGFPVFDGVGANDFQFRLEGHSPAWSEWSTRANATFLALPPGDYQLRLRARRRFGAPVEGEPFEFVIVPRWYERAWVLPLAIVLIGGLVALALIQRQRLKVRRLRAQNAELDRMVRERTRDLESANVRLRSLADSDGLTGLANRRHFDGVLEAAITRAQELRQPLALLMLDVDHFKRYNDTHGHQAGDDVLRAVATQMRDAVRADTLVARYGGEEFTVIVPSCDLQRAREIAERIRAKVATNVSGTTVSIGIAVRAANANTNADELVAQADSALYRAKHNGRDRIEHVEGDPAL